VNHAQLQYLLAGLEAELRLAQQWSNQQIAPKDMLSSEPFAVDKLSFSQWLQFVFVPRLQLICEDKTPLPASCSVAPMAEEFYRLNRINAEAVIDQLASIDQLITTA
tara:strand:- start:800 stop:1120 length:321 start_codon:yes stop_codon:yes gene_type:complete